MAEQALVGGHADLRALDLPAGGLALELPGELAHLRDGLGRDGLAEEGQTRLTAFTGTRPPMVVAPERSSCSPSPLAHRPRCSYQSSSSAVDRSYTSARLTSSGPIPASA